MLSAIERKLCDRMTLERLVLHYLSSSEGIHNEPTSVDELPIMPLKSASKCNERTSSDVFSGLPLSSPDTYRPVERSNSARAHSSSSLTSQITTSSPRHDLNSLPIGAGIPFTGHRSLQRTASDPISMSAFPLSAENSNVTESLTGDIGTISCRYKTELCRSFEEHGTCKYGEKCQFAHGRHELRVVSRHPKYKTDLCKTYHSTGLCPYGSRCHFIHKSDEDTVAHQRLMEDRIKLVKEQELLLLQQQKQQRQQQQQQELLVIAMMQASRQRHQSQLSASVTSPTKWSSLPSQRSAIGISPSFCDSFDSLANSSMSSSESDSPVPSPSHSMFGGDEMNCSAESVCESLPSQSSNFSWTYPRQPSVFNQFSSSNCESNFSSPYNIEASEAFVCPKLDLRTDFQESQMFTGPQRKTSYPYDSTHSHLASSLISSLSAHSKDTEVREAILLAELLKAIAAAKECQQKTASTVSQCSPPIDFNERFQNVLQFSALI